MAFLYSKFILLDRSYGAAHLKALHSGRILQYNATKGDSAGKINLDIITLNNSEVSTIHEPLVQKSKQSTLPIRELLLVLSPKRLRSCSVAAK